MRDIFWGREKCINIVDEQRTAIMKFSQYKSICLQLIFTHLLEIYIKVYTFTAKSWVDFFLHSPIALAVEN